MIRLIALALPMVGLAALGCRGGELRANTEWPFSDATPRVVDQLAITVDRCLASLRVQLDEPDSAIIRACACPRARDLNCRVGDRFIAFAGSRLPTRASWRPHDGLSEYGLAYFPDQMPWLRLTEFDLNGFATLNPNATRLGPKWYLVSICGICD